MRRKLEKHSGAPPDLINGRAMMAVCLLYEDVTGAGRGENRGLKYLQTYLKDYKRYQDEVRSCLNGCYEVLVEDRKDVNPEHIKLIKKTIAAEIKYVWDGRPRPRSKEKKEEKLKEEKPTVESPLASRTEQVTGEETEIDWESRFTEGEFDLE